MQKVKSNSLLAFKRIALCRLSYVLCYGSTNSYSFDRMWTDNVDTIKSGNLFKFFLSALLPVYRKANITALHKEEHFLRVLKKLDKFSIIKFFVFYRRIQPKEDESDEDHHSQI